MANKDVRDEMLRWEKAGMNSGKGVVVIVYKFFHIFIRFMSVYIYIYIYAVQLVEFLDLFSLASFFI